jgi:beta-glucuronidase
MNKIRELHTLDGCWDFQVDPDEIGESQGWFHKLPNPEPMAVPASFNELVDRPELRDYLGSVWYLRRFFVPASWTGRRIWLRCGAVNYRATVWINGEMLMEQDGGHLPFEKDAAPWIAMGEENVIAIRVNNILDWSCVPPGFLQNIPGTERAELQYYFDFFNYAGIHRSVHLYATHSTFLADVTIRTLVDDGRARVEYKLEVSGDSALQRVQILDATGTTVETQEITGFQGEFRLDSFQYWGPGHPYRYRMVIELLDEQGRICDQYIEEFGIRTVQVQGNRLLLNGEPIYLKGCGRHDDFYLIGRGFNLPLIQKDLNLLRWLGANSFRTSHYPYSEEMMQWCDRLGILVIDEISAVGLHARGQMPVFSPDHAGEGTLQNHCRMLTELYRRDKNHPAVIMWSVANEPDSSEPGSRAYFEKVVETIRSLDTTRPVTMVLDALVDKDQCGQLCDLLCVNRYYGWYTEAGQLDAIPSLLKQDLLKWHQKYGKPIMLTEFGADTMAGLHTLPPQIFSEEYQVEFLKRYCETLDELDFIVGEHVWNLADFMTRQAITRMIGNRKGVFTRDRQPKMAAHYLRERWINYMEGNRTISV